MQTFQAESAVTEAVISLLPEPVQRYMRYTGVVGKSWIETVHLEYGGKFRLAADKPWMPMRAEQVYTIHPPSFRWKAHFRIFGLPLMYGQDTYAQGQGHMFGKLAGLVTIFDVRERELLQGTMLRYLQEMMWFPTAYLSKYVTWRGVDSHSADVTYTYEGESVTGRIFFDDVGRVLSFVARRYRETQGTYQLDTWATPMTEYGTFEGLRLPIAGCGVWQLTEGDLPYIQLHLTDLTYNVPIKPFTTDTTLQESPGK